MANDSPDSRLRVSRRSLGSLGSGLVIAVLAPSEADAQGKPPPRRSEPATPLARRGCSVTVLNGGLLLVAGGMQSTTPTSAVQLYDPNSGRWFTAPPMNTPRAHHAAVALSDGSVLVTGGRFMTVLASAEIYDPRTEQWSLVAPMNGPRAEHGAVAHHGGNVLVTGGIHRVPLSSVELYDAGANAWRRL